MELVCPECKNNVDLSLHLDIAPGDIVECNMCGITLGVVSIDEDKHIKTEIADEGK